MSGGPPRTVHPLPIYFDKSARSRVSPKVRSQFTQGLFIGLDKFYGWAFDAPIGIPHFESEQRQEIGRCISQYFGIRAYGKIFLWTELGTAECGEYGPAQLVAYIGSRAVPDTSVEEPNRAGWTFEGDCFDGVVVGVVWASSPQVAAGNDAGAAVFCCEVANHPCMPH